MTTTTVPSMIEPPVWDYCPRWCRNLEHPEHPRLDDDGAPDGTTYRLGDVDPRSPHYRPTGGGEHVYVALERANNHLGSRAASNLSTTHVRVALDRDAVPITDDGDPELSPWFYIDPAAARSLARALVSAADLAEGVTT